jgi:hypothetical protein
MANGYCAKECRRLHFGAGISAMRSVLLFRLCSFLLLVLASIEAASAAEAPRLEQKDGRYNLMVDG